MVRFLQGAILAAGYGERMQANGSALPKPLVEVGGEPLLLRQARLMAAAGVRRVIAVVNSKTFDFIGKHLPQLLSQLELKVHDTASSMETMLAFADYLTPGLFLAATVDAVLSRLEFLGFCSRAAARLANENLRLIGAASGKQPAQSLDGVLAVTPWRGDERPVFVSASPNGAILRFERDERLLVTAGVYALHTRLFTLAPRSRLAGLTALRQWFAIMPELAARLVALEVKDAIDVDEITDLRAANAMLKTVGEA